MRAEIKELHQRLKTTTVYVTHDQIEAMTMADKIVVMHDGNVEQIGAPLELYDHPANLFVAGFIGSPAMNFLPRQLGRTARAPAVELADGARAAGAGRRRRRRRRRGVRPAPRALALGGDGGLAAEVVVVEPTGAETQVLCAPLGGTEIVAVLPRAPSLPSRARRSQLAADAGQRAPVRRGNRASGSA